MEKPDVVLVAPCILDAQFQAVPPKGLSHWGLPFVELLKDRGVEIFPLPCVETGFCGIPRGKHGVNYYQALKGYPEYCEKQARDAVQKILSLRREGKNVVACLGVEHSPSCAVSYMYTHHGMAKRAGIFFEELFAGLDKADIKLERIGVNRKHPKKAYIRLQAVLSQWGQER